MKFSHPLILAVALVGGCCMMHHDKDDHEVTISQSDTPPAVLASFQKTYPNAKISKIEKETESDGQTQYEFKFTGSDGKNDEVELDSTGKVLEDH